MSDLNLKSGVTIHKIDDCQGDNNGKDKPERSRVWRWVLFVRRVKKRSEPSGPRLLPSVINKKGLEHTWLCPICYILSYAFQKRDSKVAEVIMTSENHCRDRLADQEVLNYRRDSFPGPFLECT